MLKFELFWKRESEGPIQKKNSKRRGLSVVEKFAENLSSLSEID